ncbi:hypothetical protein SBRCBS47491_001795 [Sporothrix bragantina]|uniref:FAD-binding domain-containing protein n=1 Tax=Sporothrix bragantina TaxID=671064 RepID=A0ABP0B1M1_9PEZI
MTTKPTALIVGAGISGLSAAWWLDKAGWRSILIERSAAIRDGGYVMSLAGPSRKTIKEMGLQDTLEQMSIKFEENIILDKGGHELIRFKYEDVHGSGPEGSLAICRDDLARIISQHLPEGADIRFSETLGDVSEEGDKIKATLKTSGESIEADLLIGADGIRSDVRSRFWRDVDCLEHLGYSYAVYDVEGTATDTHTSTCVTYNSPGHADILYELRDKRLAGLHLWRDDAVHLNDRADRMKTVREATEGAGIKAVSDVVNQAEKAGCTPVVDSLTMVNLPQWSKGRVLLLGDAAHCLTLISGQGAGMALVSAEILGKELQATKDVAHALANHGRRLRPAITRLQDRSRSMAAVYVTKNWLGYFVRNLILKILPYRWIVAWLADSAKAELKLLNE